MTHTTGEQLRDLHRKQATTAKLIGELPSDKAKLLAIVRLQKAKARGK